MTPNFASAVLGTTDCESSRGDWLGQPINTLTSLGYVLLGAALIANGMRRRRQKGALITYGSVLVAIGAGSVAFHGPQPRGSQFAHDAPITAALYFILVDDLVALGRLREGQRAFLVGVVPVTILGAVPTVGALTNAALAAAVITTEVLLYRSVPAQQAGRRVVGVLLIAAGSAYLLGRTGSPLCVSNSPFQLHGAWHVLSALALAAWGWVALAGTQGSDEEVGSTR